MLWLSWRAHLLQEPARNVPSHAQVGAAERFEMAWRGAALPLAIVAEVVLSAAFTAMRRRQAKTKADFGHSADQSRNAGESKSPAVRPRLKARVSRTRCSAKARLRA